MIRFKYNIKPQKQKIPYILAANQRLILMPVGDVHFGSDGWPKEEFIDHLQWGMDRGAYFLGMGEYLDITSESQRGPISQLRESVRRQLDDSIRYKVQEFCSLVAFTKGRWIGMIEGDHYWPYLDQRTCDQDICKYLDTNFFGTSVHIRLVHGPHPSAHCIVYAHHGIGSSRTSGGHLHRVEDMLKWIDADIYLMGHTHAKVANPIDRQYLTPEGVHYHRTKMIARTGAFLRGYLSQEPLDLDEPAFLSRGSYVEKMAYVPTAMGGLCIGIGFEQIEGSQFHRPTIHYSV